MTYANKNLVRKPGGKTPFQRPRHRTDNNIRNILKKHVMMVV
jgi:hypothetical protein